MAIFRSIPVALIAAFAAVCPAAASAQATPAPPALVPGEVVVRIASIGVDRSPATKVAIGATLITSADTIAAARTANAALFDKVVGAVQAAGGDARKVRVVPPARTLGFIGNEMPDVEAIMAAGNDAPREMRPNPRRTVTNRIEVQLPDYSLFEKVRDAMETAGATSVGGPVLALSDDAPARRAARADAVKKAKVDAQSYADTLGLRSVRLVRINEAGTGDEMGGMMQSFMQFANLGGGLETAPGIVSTSQIVSVEFVLGPK